MFSVKKILEGHKKSSRFYSEAVTLTGRFNNALNDTE